jgi:phosphoribosylformimino-5-aminoimidazole carboxamide ribotide isomerase
VLVVPSIDVANGRSRLVYWPGAATGVGSPTDRPERIAERFVAMGASVIHVVDLDGAWAGQPVNLETIGRIAAHAAVPLQLAGGLEGADNIRLAFAAGATRAVVSMAMADRPDELRACLAVAGEWLAVGLDPRPERIAAYPWRRPAAPTLEELIRELASLGVRRFVVSRGGALPDLAVLTRLAGLAHSAGAEIFVAGGAANLDTIRSLRDASIAGIILGEPLLSGAVDFAKALETAS